MTPARYLTEGDDKTRWRIAAILYAITTAVALVDSILLACEGGSFWMLLVPPLVACLWMATHRARRTLRSLHTDLDPLKFYEISFQLWGVAVVAAGLVIFLITHRPGR